MPERQLTKCELELMEIIWRSGRVTVQEVADQLDRTLAYTTVMSTINTLDKKGSIRRCGKTGRAYIYEAVVGKDEVQQAMTADLTGSLYGGSAKALMMSLLGTQTMSRDEIAELKAAIQKLEAGS